MLYCTNMKQPDVDNISEELKLSSKSYSLTWIDFLTDILNQDINTRPNALSLFNQSLHSKSKME